MRKHFQLLIPFFLKPQEKVFICFAAVNKQKKQSKILHAVNPYWSNANLIIEIHKKWYIKSNTDMLNGPILSPHKAKAVKKVWK